MIMNPVDRKFEEHKTNFIETIVYVRTEQAFKIKREYKDHTVEFKELSEWHLVKEVTDAFVIVIRTVETLELEKPTKLCYFKVPISYRVMDNIGDGKYFYMIEDISQDPDDEFGKKFLTITIRNVSIKIGFPCPLPSSLYRGEFPWLKITVGKSIKLDPEEIETLLTKEPLRCLGIFDNVNLTNRVVG